MSEEQKQEIQVKSVKPPENVMRAARELWPAFDGVCLRHGITNIEDSMNVIITMLVSGIIHSSPEIKKTVEENSSNVNETTKVLLDTLNQRNNLGVVDILATLNTLATIVKTLAKVRDEVKPPDSLEIVEPKPV